MKQNPIYINNDVFEEIQKLSIKKGISIKRAIEFIYGSTIYKKLENKADSIAYAAASKDFKDFDEKMRDKLKKQYEQIQVNAMKVKLKAAQSVAVAKSKIIAKLGL